MLFLDTLTVVWKSIHGLLVASTLAISKTIFDGLLSFPASVCSLWHLPFVGYRKWHDAWPSSRLSNASYAFTVVSKEHSKRFDHSETPDHVHLTCNNGFTVASTKASCFVHQASLGRSVDIEYMASLASC